MDELDRRLSALRAGIHNRITPPPVDAIIARARHRRTQHRAQYAVAALVAILAVVVPVATLAGGRHSTGPASTGPVTGPSTITVSSPVPATVAVTDTPSATAGPTTATASKATAGQAPLLYDADFRNPGYVYALVGTPSSVGAVTTLYASRDSGRTWTQHSTPLPPVTGDAGYLADLVVLGQYRLLVRQPLSIPDWGFQTWYSADGGDSWTGVPDEAGGQADPIDTIPGGAVLTTECVVADPEHPDRCAGWNLAAIQPDTGELAELANQPKLDPLVATRIEPAADGRWWVTGTVDGQPAVAVSADGGSWSVHKLPVHGKPTAIEVATAGSFAWAAVRGTTDTEKNALLGIAQSRDDGTSFSLLYQPTIGTDPRTFLAAPIPERDAPGVIIYTQSPNQDTAYLVRDDGTTAATAPPAPGTIRWTGSGYLSIADSTVYTSTDGHTFRTMKSPLG